MTEICVRDVRKTYGNAVALDGVSFEVRQGELFGIIGPDGAGKTTLFRIMTSLLLPDSGSITVAGLDAVSDYTSLRSLIGYMPGRFSLYQDLSVYENLSFFAALFGTSVRQNYALIEPVYRLLEPFRNRRAGHLSGGMKQKLALCCALIHKPRVLFLDEPTTGVDPVSRKEFWEMLRGLQQQGITIVVSTPYMDEACQCDRIALIKDGRFMTIDSPDNIRRGFSVLLWALRSDSMHTLLRDARRFPMVEQCYAFGDTHHMTVLDGFDPEAFTAYLAAEGHTAVNLMPITPTIEDCYMQLAQN